MSEQELRELKPRHVLAWENEYPAIITQIDWSKNKRKNSRFIEIHPQGRSGLKRQWVKLQDLKINPHFADVKDNLD